MADRLRSVARAGVGAALAWSSLVAASPARAVAQDTGSVRTARVHVSLSAPAEPVTVRVEYEVVPGGDGVVPVALLEQPGSTGIEVRRVGGATVPLRTASGSRRTALVEAPSTAADGSVLLAFEYSVTGALDEEGPRYVARVPVLAVSLPPAADGGDVFSVVVSTPERWSVVDGFPSGLRAVGPGSYEAALPVVPSVIGVRGRTDGAWRPGIDLAVELGTLAVLLAFLVIGWRRLGAGGRVSGAGSP